MKLWTFWKSVRRVKKSKLILSKHWLKRLKLRSKGDNLRSEGDNRFTRGNILFAEGAKLRQEYTKLLERNIEFLEEDDRLSRLREHSFSPELRAVNQALLRDDHGHAACNKIRAELQALEVASAKIAGESDKIRAEGNRLCAEGDKLREKADKCWVEAVRSKFGNITMNWGDDGSCTLENGEVYRAESGG